MGSGGIVPRILYVRTGKWW